MSRAAVFLDRDGTLIGEWEYPLGPDGIELLPGVVPGLHRLRGHGFLLILLTNQRGIDRGLFTMEEYRAGAARVEALLGAAGVHPDYTDFCPHDPEVSGPCDCRKPECGMFLRAKERFDIDLARSWCVGDRVRDLLPARSLGMAGAVLVRTGAGVEEAPLLPPGIPVVDGVAEAAERILQATLDSADSG